VAEWFDRHGTPGNGRGERRLASPVFFALDLRGVALYDRSHDYTITQIAKEERSMREILILFAALIAVTVIAVGCDAGEKNAVQQVAVDSGNACSSGACAVQGVRFFERPLLVRRPLLLRPRAIIRRPILRARLFLPRLRGACCH